MPELASANPERPALYTVIKGEHRKRTVAILEWEEGEKTAMVVDSKNEAIFLIRLDSLERTFRTPREKELGRDFTADEAAEHERKLQLRVAEHQVGYHRDVVLAKIESIATSRERASQDVRRAAEQSEHYGLASAVSRVQHDVAWLFPNLGADTLTTSLVEFLRMETEVKRLGLATEEGES
jgi:hypothetical protein